MAQLAADVAHVELSTKKAASANGASRRSASAATDGLVEKLHVVEVAERAGRFERVDGTETTLDADLVLLALGFVHPEKAGLVEALGLGLDRRGNVAIDPNCMTNVPGVFAAGDCQRGQSLVVWAIADGRRAARAIDLYLMGKTELG